MAIEDVVSALLPVDDLSQLPALPPPRMNLIGQGNKVAAPLPAPTPAGPSFPRPADLFGSAPLPYPREFYEPLPSGPWLMQSPEELRLEQLMEQQQNRQQVMVPMFGGMV